MKNRKVLIIEDEITFCTILKNYLETLGLEIYTADNGQLAIEMLTEERINPDIILCDLNMPVMDGEAFMRELVARNIDIPVIVITATTDFTQLDRMFRLGAKDALLKPIKNLDEVKVTLLSALYPEQNSFTALNGEDANQISVLMQEHTQDMLAILKQLQPPVHQIINSYRINYRQLNEANRFGLLLDLAAISDSQIGFYCIDTERSSQEGIMAAFLIRVVFNDLLKSAVSYPDKKLPNIDRIINQINYLLEDSGFNGQFPLLLGYFNTQNKSIIMASAGLEAEITTENTHVKLPRNLPLGTLKFYQSNHLEVKGNAWQCLIRNNSQKIKLMFNPET
ncbi:MULTISPECIES: two-component system response regulator RssB [Providencia]|uniref:Regulator of RpoS n=1 Tax=Providencia rettgeri TaxID=587 RepID=A0A3R8W7Y8_PRORE|nr:two-component system response regulator RssB [Providencia rettgeri]ELR5073658.1 two-component system response regulator RssB [Providencia stuartii]ELR5068562.1 two-component system response regulator RssB [Providencia rettgeri]ELR5216705.1 two-component system response regulator RssB [Providencia rettgeri]ELR5221443.1 two-component system response regulator RssB [Providencia rettgeri]MBV2190781.1 two-component system response regulator RssB [Providencia rettgeri]